MTKINRELLKGASEALVLKVLEQEALHGYEIAKRIKELSDDVFSMGEGTLYPILHKLEQAGWLEATWDEVQGRRRKYYAITKTGKQALSEKQDEWSTFSSAVTNMLR